MSETAEERRLRLELEKLLADNAALRKQLKEVRAERDALEGKVVPLRERER
jgi:hypothetical protein